MGFRQIPGVDFHEIHAPVLTEVAFRALLALALNKGHSIVAIDVEKAFLESDLNEEIYISIPNGLKEIVDVPPNTVCKLRKAVYGLVQAAKEFYKKIVEVLKSIGFIISLADPCLGKIKLNSSWVYIGIYVDDVLMIGNKNELNILSAKLKQTFGIRTKFPVEEFVGCKLQHDKAGITLHQSELVKKLNEEFKGELTKMKGHATPMGSRTHVVKPSKENAVGPEKLTRYQSGTGTLLYLVKHSRPDIANAVRELTRCMSIASEENYQQMLRVIKYVVTNGVKGVRLDRSGLDIWKIRCYTDSDWAGNVQDRRSISGWCIFAGKNLLCWGSRSQRNVTTSSTEAEYVGISEICKELLYLINVLQFLDVKVELPVKVFVDNIGAIFLAENCVTKRTKHIDTRYHVIREHISDGIVKIVFVRSEDNVADVFTKNVTQDIFVKHGEKLIENVDQENKD